MGGCLFVEKLKASEFEVATKVEEFDLDPERFVAVCKT